MKGVAFRVYGERVAKPHWSFRAEAQKAYPKSIGGASQEQGIARVFEPVGSKP